MMSEDVGNKCPELQPQQFIDPFCHVPLHERLSVREKTDFEVFKDGINQPGGSIPPNFCLPNWLDMSLDSKLSAPPDVLSKMRVFSRGRLGQPLPRRYKEFHTEDPNNREMTPSRSYAPLHDPAGRGYYLQPNVAALLVKQGLITPDGFVVCNMKEFNEYRNYLKTIYTEELQIALKNKYKTWCDRQNMTAVPHPHEEPRPDDFTSKFQEAKKKCWDYLMGLYSQECKDMTKQVIVPGPPQRVHAPKRRPKRPRTAHNTKSRSRSVSPAPQKRRPSTAYRRPLKRPDDNCRKEKVVQKVPPQRPHKVPAPSVKEIVEIKPRPVKSSKFTPHAGQVKAPASTLTMAHPPSKLPRPGKIVPEYHEKPQERPRSRPPGPSELDLIEEEPEPEEIMVEGPPTPSVVPLPSKVIEEIKSPKPAPFEEIEQPEEEPDQDQDQVPSYVPSSTDISPPLTPELPSNESLLIDRKLSQLIKDELENERNKLHDILEKVGADDQDEADVFRIVSEDNVSRICSELVKKIVCHEYEKVREFQDKFCEEMMAEGGAPSPEKIQEFTDQCLTWFSQGLTTDALTFSIDEIETEEGFTRSSPEDRQDSYQKLLSDYSESVNSESSAYPESNISTVTTTTTTTGLGGGKEKNTETIVLRALTELDISRFPSQIFSSDPQSSDFDDGISSSSNYLSKYPKDKQHFDGIMQAVQKLEDSLYNKKGSSKDSSAQEIKINKYDAPPKDPKMHYVMKGKDDAIPDDSLTQVSVTPSQVKRMTTQLDDDAPAKGKHGKHGKGAGGEGAVPVRRDMAHSHVNKGHAKSFKGKPTQSQSGMPRKMVEHPEINQTPKGSKPSSKPASKTATPGATPSPSGTKAAGEQKTSVKEDIDKTKVKMGEVKKDMKDAGVK